MPNTNIESNGSTLIAGASAEGHGVLLHWNGYRDLTRGMLATIAAAALIPAAWLPAPKDAVAQLGRAVRSAAGSTYNYERTRKAPGCEWNSQWMLVERTVEAAAEGASYGRVALVATLYVSVSGLDLEIESTNTELAAMVRREFDNRINGEVFQAADVTRWIADVLRNRLDGIKYGGNWYVPRKSRAVAELLCSAFQAARWGREWMSPLPVATSEQLSVGVAGAFADEAGEIAADIAKARATAREAGNAEIGARAAETLMARLRNVYARIARYTEILGDNVTAARDSVHDAMVELDGVLGAADFSREWLAVSGRIAA